MPRVKKPKSHYQFLINVLRQKARHWPAKNEARRRAKRKIQIGTFKNGNPMYETKYECAICRDLFYEKQTNMDHINPVVDPRVGYVDMNTLINRLLPGPEGYQCLCSEGENSCHKRKTAMENKIRQKSRKKLKNNIK